jgi:hypothetical protein
MSPKIPFATTVATNAEGRENRAVRPQIYLVHVTDVHSGKKHGLTLLQSGVPRKLCVQRVSFGKPASSEPERSDDGHNESDRHHDSNENVVAFFHPCR